MARTLGTFNFSANFETKVAGMLDARMFCPTYADLLTFNKNTNYVFNGFFTAVWDSDPVKRGVYQLIDENNLNLPESWVKLGDTDNIPPNLQQILDDLEARISQLENDVADNIMDIITNSNQISVLQTDVSNLNTGLTSVNTRIGNVETILPNKADLVSGKVPLSQLPLTQGLVRAYNDIADRNADTDLTGVIMGLVLDPSADPQVSGSTNPRLYVNTTSGWTLYGDTSMAQAVLDWDNITNKPNSTPAQIDETVLKSKNQAELKADLTVGAWNQGESLPALSANWEDAIRKLINKTFYPTFTDPTFTLSNNAGSFREVGENVNLTLTFTYNQGTINGDLVGGTGGTWNPSVVQNPRAGIATGYTINGNIQTGNTLIINPYTALQGLNTFTGTTTYNAGYQPKDSKGVNYSTPYPSGISPVRSTSFESVYPLFATTVNITTATKQGLQSMISGNNIEINLVAEASGNKQFFQIADAWTSVRPLTNIQYFNTVSNQYDPSNKLSDFVITNITQTVQGNTVNYKKYTYNGPDRGAIKIRLIF